MHCYFWTKARANMQSTSCDWLVMYRETQIICPGVLKIFRKKDGDNLVSQWTFSCQPPRASYQRSKFLFKNNIANFMLRAGTAPLLLLTMPSK